ncbi:MAG: hypothetical protein H6959_06775 [Chromatiaceae bacterium]|nr:hypothetical protein [Gammaproteobacteria bacterium]MCP5300533.1 hypothetical protein [Chromatiaceae bacterium]MCP5422605.1 hypothetical protein [Chromatiaceae bacterium]
MFAYRIVFNEHVGKYRVERRGWLGWHFVMDADGNDYLTFDNRDDAQAFVCANRGLAGRFNSRWRVVDPCCTVGPEG